MEDVIIVCEVETDVHIVVTVLTVVPCLSQVVPRSLAEVSKSEVWEGGVTGRGETEDVGVVGQDGRHPVSGDAPAECGPQDVAGVGVQGAAIVGVDGGGEGPGRRSEVLWVGEDIPQLG